MRIAIPKGRLQSEALTLFARAGFDVPDSNEVATRKLVFQRPGCEWIFVKDCDVPVYVEQGAADAGVAGLDQILEHDCSAYQPVELPFGRCSMMLIARQQDADAPITKIASKYPRLTGLFLQERGIRAEVVPLGGSVELAVVLGLTSHVVDLVETGETIRIHNLTVIVQVAAISPRLLISRNAYRTDRAQMREVVARIATAAESQESERVVNP